METHLYPNCFSSSLSFVLTAILNSQAGCRCTLVPRLLFPVPRSPFPVPGISNIHCFLLISIARYIFKSPRICFWGTKYDVYRERVVYLHCILWRRARLWLELFASTADKFFSRVSYLPSHVFLQRRRRFIFRKLYACLEKFLCFLQLSDRVKFLELDVQGFFSFDSSIVSFSSKQHYMVFAPWLNVW